jgi:purine nucleosidase
VGKYARLRGPYDYLRDELAAAAWLDPTIITRRETRYMDVNLDRGANYGDTLTWSDTNKPTPSPQAVEIQVDLDTERFYKLFRDLLSAPTPPK